MTQTELELTKHVLVILKTYYNQMSKVSEGNDDPLNINKSIEIVINDIRGNKNG